MGEIHAASVARGMEKFSKVQNMLDFLSDNDCPSVLRHKIVQARHTHRKYLTLEKYNTHIQASYREWDKWSYRAIGCAIHRLTDRWRHACKPACLHDHRSLNRALNRDLHRALDGALN